MLHKCKNFTSQRLFLAMETFEGKLFAELDNEERKFIEF